MDSNITFTDLPAFCTSGSKSAPDASLFSTGYVANELLPAEQHNYLINALSANAALSNAVVNHIISELNNVLTLAGLSPATATVNQVLTALNTLYAKAGTSALVASTTVVRSATGTFKAAVPAATDDVARLYEVQQATSAATARQTALPIGTILMYNGTFTNNSTIAGWYICDGNNGTPNLVDKFVMGATTAGATGGSNSTTLGSGQLPAHTHTGTTEAESATHSHAFGTNTAAHVHTQTCYTEFSGNVDQTGFVATTVGASSNTISISTASASVQLSGTTGAETASHSHSFTTASSGTGAAYDSRPSYYALIFIMRVS